MMLKGRLERSPAVRLGGVPIHWATNVRYLGGTLDSGAIYRKHIDTIVYKNLHAFLGIARRTKFECGIPYVPAKLLYKPISVPIVTYGATAWVRIVSVGKYKQLIRRAQIPALIGIAKSYCTAQTEALLAIAGVFPLELEVQ